ncbi:DNA-directed RNA polymerase subunit delta [Neobacillus ginsengisoli]|uniref:Probable DNA-directed RNA polymerase subunit delta n=1 Tax=Neobacillus ginsengisoli TaxID=904295 RepID=A0ABT9XZT6_9BACI|nr:DNA-directed RNA polymerase subunit delta [Neobacillus ginsengisoli]MDQ0200893.1 DNA-directed RNA polymerase subunit delta [Neobacillus ginsengisoli]
MSLESYSKEQLKELSLIEMAYEFLKNRKQAISFNELVSEIAAAADISEQEIRSRLAQFYTDMNIDGRFLSLGENRWGLRVWYPVDTAEEEVASVVKPKKKKAKKVVDEEDLDLDDYDEIDEEEEYDDLDDFADDEDDLLEDDEDLLEDDLEEDEDLLDDDDDVIEDEEEFDLGDEEDLDDEDLEEEEEFEEEEKDK